VSCGNPENGTLSKIVFIDTTYQAVATYECAVKTEYVSGNDTRYCQLDRTWSDYPLICKGVVQESHYFRPGAMKCTVIL
jgi:hypothetical protein